MADDDLTRLSIDKTKITFRRSKRKRYILLILLLLLAAGMGVLYRNGILAPAVEVEITKAQNIYPSQTFTLLNASGYVVAQRKAAVASKITGRLVHLSVEEGSEVKKGEVIARLENDDAIAAKERALANRKVAELNLREAKVELEDALRGLNRRKKAVGQGFISESEFDAADARYRKAQASVAALEAAVASSEAALKEANVAADYAHIRAPFDAVVLTKNADIGDIVTPLGAAAEAKAAVVTIADMNSLQVEADVSESNIWQVKVGQPCDIQLDALPDTRFRGTVHMIVPTADRTKASVLVKVAFIDKDSRILPEMSAKVAFLEREVSLEEQKPATVVPSSAIMVHDGSECAFLVRDNQAVRTRLQVGRTFGSLTEVLDGVKGGEKVVATPARVNDRTRIKTQDE